MIVPESHYVHNRPIFLIAIHRSGSTTLQRVLNCHPNIVLWGEHGGILNSLAEIDEAMGHFPRLVEPMETRELDNFTINKHHMEFRPWISPVTRDGFRESVRDWMKGTFGRGVSPDQRWGVKEIRYSGKSICTLLTNLFPESQFIILKRNLVKLCVSNILVGWSLAALRTIGDFEDESAAREVVSDCCYALVVLDQRLSEARRTLGKRAIGLNYKEIPDRIADVFSFLDLDLSDTTMQDISNALSRRMGETDSYGQLGKLDRDFIKLWAKEYIEISRREISLSGIDRERLLGKSGRGRYCFLVGDHPLRSTNFSSMGWSL